ncbi:GntR family transcriptional regulator [Microbaculum marinum]|uniref:GntR family transcriptional regulator n=1 Tax=Microbaculum marinum TaxID=1764581 RepID=A0AAW9RK09_9HYPH
MDGPVGAGKRGKADKTSVGRAQAVVRRVIADGHDRPSLVSQIACEVGAEIVLGVLAPGDDLNSVELSRRHKTSRTPVREALMLLEKEGLVDVPPRRRPRVNALSLEEIRDIYRARGALFALIAGDTARGASAGEVAELRGLLGAMETAADRGDLDGYVWANVDFYDRNTQLTNNRTVKRILDSLLLRTLPLRRLSLSQDGRLTRSIDDHRRLVAAYEDRDADLAAALIRSNHMNALKALERHLGGSTDDGHAATGPSR